MFKTFGVKRVAIINLIVYVLVFLSATAFSWPHKKGPDEKCVTGANLAANYCS